MQFDAGTNTLPPAPGIETVGGRQQGGTVQVFNMNEMPKNLEGDNPMFVGSVATQRMVTKDVSDHMLIGNVTFSPGARTKRHTHETDQVIVVTGGKGILATDEEENVVTVGDVVHVPNRRDPLARSDPGLFILANLRPAPGREQDPGLGPTRQ